MERRTLPDSGVFSKGWAVYLGQAAQSLPQAAMMEWVFIGGLLGEDDLVLKHLQIQCYEFITFQLTYPFIMLQWS